MREKEKYENIVEQYAEDLIERLRDNCEKGQWKDAFHTLLHERVANHSWIEDTDNAIFTLLHSNHPSIGLVGGSAPSHRELGFDGESPFPFSNLASSALTKDVAYRVTELLKEDGIDINDAQYDADVSSENEKEEGN